MKLSQIKNLFTRLHNNESGDIPVGPILIIGLVVIPLVLAIVMFGKDIAKWLKDQWTAVEGQGGTGSKIKY